MLQEAGKFFAIALILLVGACVYIESQGGSPFAIHASSQSAQQLASGPSVVGGPSLSAQKIDQVLLNADSPAKGTGQALYDLSAQYGIDDAFALAVFKHESGYGKYGEAAYTRSLGNLRPVPGEAFERDGYAAFYTWQDGYAAFYKLIAGPLYKGSGLTTPDQIMARYAPSGDGNDPSGYAADVEQSIASWRTA